MYSNVLTIAQSQKTELIHKNVEQVKRPIQKIALKSLP